MARMKQTARKSSGGTEPRRNLATKAGRQTGKKTAPAAKPTAKKTAPAVRQGCRVFNEKKYYCAPLRKEERSGKGGCLMVAIDCFKVRSLNTILQSCNF